MNGFAELIDETSMAVDESLDNALSPVVTKAEKPQAFWTESQTWALDRLHRFADIFELAGGSRQGAFAPKTKVLLLGSTGAGKSTVAKALAHNRRKDSSSEGWGFLACDAGSWIPLGALAKPPTLRLIRDFLRAQSGKKSVLLIDELCKLLPKESASQSSWSLGCWAECLALLDCSERLCAHEWNNDDLFRLQNDALVIGAGAFMEALAEAKQHAKRGGLGFGDTPESSVSIRAKAIAKHLPPEILTRFHHEPIVIADPTRADFKRGILQIHAGLGVSHTRPLAELVDEAMKSAGGVRWFESYTADLLMENLVAITPMKEHPQVPSGKTYDFFAADAVHYTRMATDLGFELRSCLSLLLIDFAAVEKDIKEGTCRDFAAYCCSELPPGAPRKVLALALKACSLCADVSADDADTILPLMDWRGVAWNAMRMFSPALKHHGLFTNWHRTWDLSCRLIDIRCRLSEMAAQGRFQ